MSSFLTKAIDKIFQDRIRKIIDRLMKEREPRQNNQDEEINDTVE